MKGFESMSQPNEEFRRARELTPSPTCPDECLSRQELAELVNVHVWEHHQIRVEVDANYIGKLERGKIGWPSAQYRQALRHLLGVSSDIALGLINRRRTVLRIPEASAGQPGTEMLVPPVTSRRELSDSLIRAAHDSAGGSMVAEMNAGVPNPESISDAQIDLRRLTEKYFSRSNTPLVIKEVSLLGARLRHLTDSGPSPGRELRDVHVLIGAAYLLMATISHDAGEPDAGLMQTRAARVHASLAGRPQLAGWALGTAATIEFWRGRSTEALKYADRGDNLALRGDAGIRLAGLRARALGHGGRVQESVEAMRKMENLSADRERDSMAEFGRLFRFPAIRRNYYAAINYAQIGRLADVERSVAEMGVSWTTQPTSEWPVSGVLASGYLALSRLEHAGADGGPDAARDALAPVLGSPPGQRISQVRQVVAQVERRLSDRRMRTSPSAISLLGSVREFAAYPHGEVRYDASAG
jgi:transcriptional regulator with XRE-family HTH domain